MKSLRFSMLTLLLLVTIFCLAVCVYMQNVELRTNRAENSHMKAELGIIEANGPNQISVRPLASRGINCWRFRVNKPKSGFEYCFGVAKVDESNVPVLPGEYRPYFQCIDSEATGEVEVVFSVWRDENSRWWMKFQEFQGDATKVATATRVDIFPDKVVSPVWRMQDRDVTVQNDLTTMVVDTESHGEISRYNPDETVWLFRSEGRQQKQEDRQAFIIALRPVGKDQVSKAE